jgi:hypothetical protein
MGAVASDLIQGKKLPEKFFFYFPDFAAYLHAHGGAARGRQCRKL